MKMAKKDLDPLTVGLIGFAAFYLLKNFGPRRGAPTAAMQATAGIIPQSPSVGSNTYYAWVQKVLNGLFPDANIAVDGIFGKQTRSYVALFQQIVGVNADGIVGAETDSWLRYMESQSSYVWQSMIERQPQY